MGLPNAYTQLSNQLPDLFNKIVEGQAPSKFTQQHLRDIGFGSTNHRTFIPILKAINFLTSDGVPTSSYTEYRNEAKSKIILGQELKKSYADLFFIKSNPTPDDKKLIEGKFKSEHNCKAPLAALMAKTFFALLDLSDITHKEPIEKKPKDNVGKKLEEKSPDKNVESNFNNKMPPGLHYNIQIHLPATKDVEVYNSIFKSLKEHLIE